ncbi:MAG: hypothetical protein A2107_09140 [Verrucomicrobia bacterium GWF2_62_7]|nr:MAG: hypothetical protein A2107_09140 [Verrucomicrobia bacterium GWF2_62_7]
MEVLSPGQAVALVRQAWDAGINIYDTAAAYGSGQSEVVLGAALREVPRGQVVICTKLEANRCASREEFRYWFMASLARLGVERVDILFLHGLKLQSWEERILPRGLDREWAEWLAAGRVGSIGFSSHDTPDNVRNLLATGCFAAVILQYNLLDERYAGALAEAHARGMGTAVMGPMAGGLLAGEDSVWAEAVTASGVRDQRELALRYVLQQPFVDVALAGVTDFAMLHHCTVTAEKDTPLAAAARPLIARAQAAHHCRQSIYCTFCKYCLPCPHGVNVPLNLKVLMLAEQHQAGVVAQRMYERIGVDPLLPGKTAVFCTGCGQCARRCPQKLDTVDLLHRTRRLFGP